MALPVITTFSPNTTIQSSQVNTNFSNLRSRTDLESSNSHITLTAGTDKLVRFTVLDQEDTSDSYVQNNVILTGEGLILGDGSNPSIVETITFGVTFSARPVMVGNHSGYHASDSEFRNRTSSNSFAQADNVSTTNGRIVVRTNDGSATVNNARYFYTWIAIGQLN